MNGQRFFLRKVGKLLIFGVLAFLYVSPGLADVADCDRCIEKQNIRAKAITQGKLAPGSITPAKIAPAAVGAAAIAAGSVTSQDLSPSLQRTVRSGLAVFDSTGRDFPIFLFIQDYGLDSNTGEPLVLWQGLMNVRENLLVMVGFERNSINGRGAERLFYSGANCSGEIYVEVHSVWRDFDLGFPLLAEKGLAIGGQRVSMPLEIYSIGGTFRDIQAQSYREVGIPIYYPPFSEPGPPYRNTSCTNEGSMVAKARQLFFEEELDLNPPFSIKMN